MAIRAAISARRTRPAGPPDSIPAALSMPEEIKLNMNARFAFVLLAATFIMLGSALAAEGDRVDARFEIYGFAGFHVLTSRTSVQESGERYAIATDLDTRGLASVFVDLTSHSEVHGALARDIPHPDSYRADVRRNSVDRHYAVDYRRDGAVINASASASTAPPFSVSAEQIR